MSVAIQPLLINEQPATSFRELASQGSSFVSQVLPFESNEDRFDS